MLFMLFIYINKIAIKNTNNKLNKIIITHTQLLTVESVVETQMDDG